MGGDLICNFCLPEQVSWNSKVIIVKSAQKHSFPKVVSCVSVDVFGSQMDLNFKNPDSVRTKDSKIGLRLRL